MKKIIIGILGIITLFNVSLVPSRSLSSSDNYSTIDIKYTIWDDEYYNKDLIIRILYFSFSSFLVGLPAFLLMLWVDSMIGNVKKEKKVLLIDRLADASLEMIYTYLRNENISALKEKLYLRYVDFKTAIMKYDYNKLQSICFPSYYNQLVNVLNNMASNGQINVSDDFIRKGCKISNIHDEGNLVIIDFYLQLEFLDYVEDANGNLIAGSKLEPVSQCVRIEYVITKNKDDITCLNCGKRVFLDHDGKCPYCGNPVIIEAKDYLIRSTHNEE